MIDPKSKPVVDRFSERVVNTSKKLKNIQLCIGNVNLRIVDSVASCAVCERGICPFVDLSSAHFKKIPNARVASLVTSTACKKTCFAAV